MDASEKAKIKQQLEEKITEVKKTITNLKEETRPIAPDRSLGRITRMDAIQQKSVYEANLRAAEESLINLENSLKKVDEDDFGLCERCHQAIPLERILAMPESNRCIQCVGRMW